MDHCGTTIELNCFGTQEFIWNVLDGPHCQEPRHIAENDWRTKCKTEQFHSTSLTVWVCQALVLVELNLNFFSDKQQPPPSGREILPGDKDLFPLVR